MSRKCLCNLSPLSNRQIHTAHIGFSDHDCSVLRLGQRDKCMSASGLWVIQSLYSDFHESFHDYIRDYSVTQCHHCKSHVSLFICPEWSAAAYPTWSDRADARARLAARTELPSADSLQDSAAKNLAMIFLNLILWIRYYWSQHVWFCLKPSLVRSLVKNWIIFHRPYNPADIHRGTINLIDDQSISCCSPTHLLSGCVKVQVKSLRDKQYVVWL